MSPDIQGVEKFRRKCLFSLTASFLGFLYENIEFIFFMKEELSSIPNKEEPSAGDGSSSVSTKHKFKWFVNRDIGKITRQLINGGALTGKKYGGNNYTVSAKIQMLRFPRNGLVEGYAEGSLNDVTTGQHVAHYCEAL